MKEIGKIRRAAGMAMALALALGLAMTARAAGNQRGSVSVDADIRAVGSGGSAYGPGDMLAVTATVTNGTGRAVTGGLRLDFPDGAVEILSAPVLEPDGDGGYSVDGLEPGESVTAAMLVAPADKPSVTDWLLTATFRDRSGGIASDTAEASYGRPELKASKSGIVRDGVVRIWNEGDGGAGHVRFRFLAKPGWRDAKGLSDGMRVLDGGYIEVDMGAIASGGYAEKDISGLLHQRMDKSHDFAVAFGDDEAMPENGWMD